MKGINLMVGSHKYASEEYRGSYDSINWNSKQGEKDADGDADRQDEVQNDEQVVEKAAPGTGG